MGTPVLVRTPALTLEEFGKRLGLSKARQKSLQPFFIERRAKGDYALRRMGSLRASRVFATQAEAIANAKGLKPNASIFIERTGQIAGDSPKKWRRA